MLGNVCKHRSMERSGVKCFHCTHVFNLTNLKGEKRRNVQHAVRFSKKSPWSVFFRGEMSVICHKITIKCR
jgi:hypothetical protein